MPNDLLGYEEIANLTGYSVHTLRTYAYLDFLPPPDGRLGRSPYWHRETILKWCERWEIEKRNK